MTDACCLVSSFAALCASKVGTSDLLRPVVRKRALAATPLGSSRGLNFSPYFFVYIAYVFQLLPQVITKQIVSKRTLLKAQ